MERGVSRAFVVWYVISFVSCQTRFNSNVSDVEINGTTVHVSELVTSSDTAVREDELATASTHSAVVLGLNTVSTEDSVLNDRDCPRSSSKPCVVKCCPLGESIGNSKVCDPTLLKFKVNFFSEKGWSNSSAAAGGAADDDDDGDYDYIFGNPCRYERFRLEPRYDSSDEFHVLRNGSLRVPYLFPDLLEPEEYCLDVFEDPDTEDVEVLPLICFTENPVNQTPSSLHYILYAVGLLISVPFLITTILVYCLIPGLRDLHGKSLVCHILCLSVAYIFLAAVQLGGETFNQELCVVVAFVIQFSFLACFFWLNVLCFNTWWNVVANMRLQRHSKESSRNHYLGYTMSKNNEVNMPKETERKFFICYSLYAWCCPFAILIVSVIFDFVPVIPSSYLKPNFGNNKCWFSSEDAELSYFYGPVAVIIGINIVLFICTACKVYCDERRAPGHKPRQIFRMCLFLFFVMGINWVMEIVSWFVGGPEYIWYVTDVINTLQGVIIFLIFVCEPRIRSCVWKQWRQKLSPLLCRSYAPHASVIYSSPDDAVVRINM